MERDEIRGLLRAYVDSGQSIYEFCEGLEPAQVAAVKRVIRDGLVSDEPKEENVSDETPQVMEVANPAERAAAGVDESLARWRGHSDEELSELMFGLIEAESEDSRPGSDTLRAELRREIATVLERREGETPSYRGPGRYRDPDGADYEVIGWGVDGASGQRMILYRMSTAMSADQPNGYWGVPVESFERREDAERAFEYLGPLEGS